MVGQSTAHHEATTQVGEGGMGVVHGAKGILPDRTAALEFIAPGALEISKARLGLCEERERLRRKNSR